MKLYPELTLEERFALAKLRCTCTETSTVLYSEEGVYDMDNKIRKRIIQDGVPVEHVLEGRKFTLDPTHWHAMEVWQIPVPNYREVRTLKYYATGTDGGFLVAEHAPAGTVYYFVGESLETVVAQLQRLLSTDL